LSGGDPVAVRGHPRFAGRTVGLLGGSFNPAHAGHRHISLAAMRQLGLDAIWWLVSPQNPLKSAQDMAPQAVRLAKARAVAAHPAIFPTDIETQLGTRYTVETLAALQKYHPNVRFIWLMGGDSLASFHRWKSWPKIARMMPIAILPRPGYSHGCWSTPAKARLGKWMKPHAKARQWQTWRTPALVILSFPLSTLSATALRAADPHWSRSYGAGVAGQTNSPTNIKVNNLKVPPK
jgi:nicotinate-nucleotide adenylyltransferase